MRRLLIRADGAARGNPGPAAAGAVLIDADRPGATAPDSPPLAVVARPLGIATNNFAEYTAVVLALERARLLGAEEVELVLDSKLVVEQLMGRWRVREATLAPLYEHARRLLTSFRRWSIRHEPRAANFAADALANLALDDPAAAAAAEETGRSAVPRPTIGKAVGRAGGEAVGRAIVGAACALFDPHGRVLLVRHTYGRRNWELPGGHALPGEAPDDAARRELEEETGLALAGGRLTGVYYETDNEERGPAVHFVFRFPWSADLRPTPHPPEIDEVGFWPPTDLPRPICDFTERRIADAADEAVSFGVVRGRAWRE